MLDHHQVGGRFYHTQERRIAFGRATQGAELVLGKSIAALAVADRSRRGVERERQPLCPFAVVVQQVARHPMRRLGSDAGQAAQRLGQLLETAEWLHESTKTEV